MVAWGTRAIEVVPEIRFSPLRYELQGVSWCLGSAGCTLSRIKRKPRCTSSVRFEAHRAVALEREKKAGWIKMAKKLPPVFSSRQKRYLLGWV